MSWVNQDEVIYDLKKNLGSPVRETQSQTTFETTAVTLVLHQGSVAVDKYASKLTTLQDKLQVECGQGWIVVVDYAGIIFSFFFETFNGKIKLGRPSS